MRGDHPSAPAHDGETDAREGVTMAIRDEDDQARIADLTPISAAPEL